MLACASCDAALAITLLSDFSVSTVEKICNAYRQQLATAHEKDCPFRLDAEQFLRLEETQQGIVPTQIMSVLPQEFVELMEKPSPSTLLRQRVQQLEKVCPSSPSSTWVYPSLEISEEIRKYRLNDDDTREGTELISAISGLLGTDDSSMLTLAILGWTPIDAPTETDPDSGARIVSLGCPMCLSLMELTLKQKENESQDAAAVGDRAPKRLKKLARFCNPHDAHRHYCPFKCGFPKTLSGRETPLWQVLLSRLHREKESKETVHDVEKDTAEDLDQSVDRIRKILRSAIVPKKVDLTIEESETEDY